MAGLSQIFGPRIALHRRLNRTSTIVRRDAGRHAFCGFDRHGEIGRVRGTVDAHHQRQAQLSATISRQRETDQPARVARHEVHILGAHRIRGHDQIAFVLAILVIHDHDHAAGTDVRENFIDGIELHVIYDCGRSTSFRSSPTFSLLRKRHCKRFARRSS